MAYSIGSPLNLMSLVPDFRLEGLKEAQTFATTQQGIAQGIDNQRAIRQDARQQEFYKAINETPPEQIASLRRKFPEFTQAIQQELGIQSAEHSAFVNSALNKISIAASTGNPNEIANALNSNSAALSSLGVSKDDAWQLYQQDPGRFNSLLNASRLATLPMDKQFDVQHKRDQLNEQIRSNQAGEALQARGQDISRANALTSAYAPTAAMQNYNQYAQMLKADPEGAAAFAAAAGINTNAKKLMSVRENDDGTVTKYYTDGSEEQGKLNQPISGDGFRPIALPTAQKIMEKSPEGAKKAAGFAYRVRDALDSIDTLKDQLSPQRVAIINNALGNGTLANLTLSPAEQQYVVNANDAIMAILRQETGAAIAPAEMSKYYQMYFPQPGDSTKTIDTKRRKMENQFNSLKAASGRTYDALRVISAVDRGTASSSQTLPQSEQVSQPAASSKFSSLWGD
ncbi:acyltransferase [Escherichia coli]|nr:acyltransferase [Escherichia coli]EFF6776149.1 acyltransferase [Escherichia coli]